jgi:chorismate synthase
MPISPIGKYGIRGDAVAAESSAEEKLRRVAAGGVARAVLLADGAGPEDHRLHGADGSLWD